MYRPSTPATDDDFFDRERELELLTQHISRLCAGAPSWVAVLGRRKLGKTSLLLELARRQRSPLLAFAVLDSFELAPLGPDVLRRYALRVVDAVLGPRAGISLEALSRRPGEYRAALADAGLAALPREVRALLHDLPDLQVRGPVASELLDLPERLASALELRVVVAWDEFQALGNVRGRSLDLLPLMRSVWQRHRHVSYFVSGSERTLLEDMLTAPHAPFYQHFSILHLEELPEADARGLLVQGAPPDQPVPPQAAARLVRSLGGHPFYLQLAGDDLTRAPPPYDAATVKDTLQALLFSRTGRLALFFEGEYRALVGRATTLAATLEALAHKPRRLAQLARAIGSGSGATARYLERLGDAVTNEDGEYRVSDPVFGLWLRWRAPGGTVVPMRLLGDDAEIRAASHLADLGFDLVYQSRASRGAFDLLAIRAGRQLGVQVKRRRLPLRFSLAAWQRMEAEARRLGWRWVVLAVSPTDDSVQLLDPAQATGQRERRLAAGARIENMLRWFDGDG